MTSVGSDSSARCCGNCTDSEVRTHQNTSGARDDPESLTHRPDPPGRTPDGLPDAFLELRVGTYHGYDQHCPRPGK